MKNIITRPLSAILSLKMLFPIGAIVLFACNETTKQSAIVLKERAEDQLVSVAGEGEVAIKLLQLQYVDLKEQLVRTKTMKASLARQATASRTRAAQFLAEGQQQQASNEQQRVKMYEEKIAFIEARESRAQAELDEFAILYEQQKSQIRLLQEELAVVRATGNLGRNLDINSPSIQRMEKVDELMEKLRGQLDRAQAILEVNG